MRPGSPPEHALAALLIGASAGGVDALLRLLPALPAGLPATVLVVLHRGAQNTDTLAQLLATRCALPVEDAWDRQPLLPGTVTLAPPDYHLLVDAGPRASLSIDPSVLWSRPAIDPLFETAAAVFGRRTLALVLTGASSDGAHGARAVRRAGGRLWVQQPTEAMVPTMPQSALDEAGADAVLTLDEMAERLQNEWTWKDPT
jgi:two-component system, chemotaxis family, protein-glutamate methylesterase/glutaminase